MLAHFPPDGKRIAFSRQSGKTGSTSAVLTIAVDGRAAYRVTPYEKSNEPLGWSPDGKFFLFERKDPFEDFGEADLYVSRPDGSGQVKIATRIAAGMAAWRPR